MNNIIKIKRGYGINPPPVAQSRGEQGLVDYELGYNITQHILYINPGPDEHGVPATNTIPVGWLPNFIQWETSSDQGPYIYIPMLGHDYDSPSIPAATTSVTGVITAKEQSLGGKKTFVGSANSGGISFKYNNSDIPMTWAKQSNGNLTLYLE